MNKIFKIILACLVFLFGLAQPGLSLAATLSLSPSSGTFNRGCSFSVKVDLDTAGVQTDGADAIILYDSTRFTPGSITNGTIYPDYPGNFIDTQARKINISGLASVTQAFSGAGTLATINFTVPQNAPAGLTELTFDFDQNDKAKTTDSNVVERSTVVDVLNSVTNGSYTIGTGSCASQGVGAPSQSTPSGQQLSSPLPTLTPGELPNGGFTHPTIVLTAVGMVLVILGILGLALL